MDDPESRKWAMDLWRQAYRCQMEGRIDRAIHLYKRSIDVHPTAEAHTFLGWALSFQGKLSAAVAECLRAIEIDPDFGNPYNDIGVYLMEQGRLDEAVEWLERAKAAPRYEPRHYPYLNLGQVYVKQGRWWEALAELQQAELLAPEDVQIRKALHGLLARLN